MARSSSGKAPAKQQAKSRAAAAGSAARATAAVPTGGRLRRFLREVWSEMSKVTWPPRSELVQSTMVVLVAVAIAAAYIGLWDLIWSSLVNFVRIG